MLRQIEICGQRFELRTLDDGRTWASDPRSLIAYRRRQEAARLDLQKRFAMMEENIPGPDPDYFCELEFPKGFAGGF